MTFDFPIEKLKYRLSQLPEEHLIECLDITTSSLVELLTEHIEENYDEIMERLEWYDPEDEEEDEE